MSGRLRFEAWTLPTAGTFEKITDIPAMSGSTGTRELSAYSDGSLTVAADWDGLDLIISDTVGSLIRVYDGTTLVDEFLAERLDVPVDRPSAVTVSGTQINGIVEKLAVYPYNYPNDIPTSQDWVWGGPTILPSLTLADLGNIREVWELWHNGTGGSYTLTVDGQTTASIDYTIVSPLVIENRLQSLSTVTDVTVSGDGSTTDTPFVITFHNPPNPGTFTITDSLTGGSATLTQITAGALDPSPITQSQRADARIDPDLHGTYADPAIQAVETNLNTGSDWALLVNATGQFAGSQIILSVKPGHTYSNITVPVRPDSNGDYRLVIRDIYENLVAGPDVWETALTAGTYQTLTVPQFTVPDGVHQIIMRVAVVGATYADFRVDWQHATINEGDATATPGEIVRILVENAQDERTAFTFLDIAGFSDTVDTAATSWGSSISFTASFGQHMGHVLDGLAALGYEWQITPKGTPSGGFTHDLDLFMPDGAGTDHTATTGGPAVMSNTVAAANVVKRIPAYTAGLAWGNETYLEDTDATRLTNFGRLERVFDVEHLSSTASLQELLDEQFAEQATNLTATQATIRDDTTTPLVDYDVGDTIWWQFPETLTKQARRIKRISWAHDNQATYTLHASTVHTGDSAMAAAVNKLLNRYERRRGTGTTAEAFKPIAGRHTPIIVAGSDATAAVQGYADYVLDGTNDKTQLHNALQQASNDGSNDVLLIGTANITLAAGYPTGVDLPFDVVLRGMGPGGYSTLQFTGEDSAGTAVNINSGRGGIHDLDISRSGSATVDMNIVVINSAGFARNVSITGTWQGDGVVAYGNNFDIDHVDIANLGTGFDRGFFVSGPTKGRIRDCAAISCDTAGVYLDGCAQILVQNFVGTSNVTDVLVPSSGASDIVIANLQGSSSTSWAVDVQNAQRVSVVGGSLDSPTNGIRYGAGATQGIVAGVSMRQFSSGVGVESTGTGTRVLVDSNSFKGFTTGINIASSGAAVIGDNDFDTVTTHVAGSETLPPFGQIYLTTPAATTIASSGVFYKMSGTTTLVSGGNLFDMPANNRLRYTGTRPRIFLISVTGGSTTANNNVTLQYRLAKNGTTVAATQVTWLKKTGTDQRTFPINHVVSLANNDYIELFVNNTTGTGNVTLQHMNMIANGIL